MIQHHRWWYAWHCPLYLVQPRLTAEGIFFLVFVIWIYMATSFQTETNDLFFNNLTTFKTTWQEPPDPLGSSHPKPATSVRDFLQNLPDYWMQHVLPTHANVMQVNCQMKLGNPSSSARFTSQWKWQGRLPWIPIKSLTNEDKAELGQIMQKKRTHVSFREKKMSSEALEKTENYSNFWVELIFLGCLL